MRRGPNWIEAGAAVATGLLHILFYDVLDLRGIFIALAMSGWVGYAILRAQRHAGAFRAWGFRRKGLRETSLAASMVAVPALVVMAVIGSLRENPLSWHILPVLALYPLWGIVQQFMVQGLVATNLRKASGAGLPEGEFASDLPDLELSLATFALGFLFTPIYLRHGNLWPLGLFHGWLGAFFYFWVLGQDPWTLVVG